MAPHLRGGGFHVPLEVVQPVLDACNVEVMDSELLRARCPAEEMHTTDTVAGECVIYPNRGIPRIFCHHTSCMARVKEVNRQLWLHSRNAGHTAAARSFDTTSEKQTGREKYRRRKILEQKAANLLPGILEKYHWSAATIAAESPTELILPVERQHRYICDLFEDDDLLWCAPEVKDTGSYWHRKHFRTAERWSTKPNCPGAFICPNPFVAGTYSRSDANIAHTKFLVVESDKLDRNQVGAVFRWLRECYRLELRAVVDTGNRSLHGWFQTPPPQVLETLRIILPVMGCDPAMFRPAQPCRLPGVIRPQTGRWQELLYLAPAWSGVATDICPSRGVDNSAGQCLP